MSTNTPVTATLALTEEGGGVVATCSCGWLTWTRNQATTLELGRIHQAKAHKPKASAR